MPHYMLHTSHIIHITHYTHYTLYTLHIIHITHYTHHTLHIIHITHYTHYTLHNIHYTHCTIYTGNCINIMNHPYKQINATILETFSANKCVLLCPLEIVPSICELWQFVKMNTLETRLCIY